MPHSDFNDPIPTPLPLSTFEEKIKLHSLIHELRQPFLILYTGSFIDVLLAKDSNFLDIEGSTFTQVGDGKKKLKWTTLLDSALAVPLSPLGARLNLLNAQPLASLRTS